MAENTNEDPVSVTGSSVVGAFPLVAGGQAAELAVDALDIEVVTVAATALAGDLKLVTGVEPAVVNSISTAKPVIIGTLNSSFIAQLVAAGKLDASQLEGKWETFLISVVDNPLPDVEQALVIAGSDPRGAAFGVFELSRMMGVSPWVWFADVLPEHKDEVYVTQGQSIFGPPSVKYRGMFINDEDWGMQPWAAKNMDTDIRPNGKGDMGPRTHERIFELMLRTKSNYFWPAMHSCTKAFWFYKENPVVARKYQIALGGSHCDILLRDNEDEWRNNFATEYPGVTRGDYNWRTNRSTLIRYWGDRIKESADNPAVYGIGMRGIHDSGIEGYTHGSQEHKAALEDLFATQRSMLQDTLGKPAAQIPQMFIPYKEVLPVYNMGLNVPDDVTIMWADDNFGYIRRLSTPSEQARSGGGGVYFHFSYWGSPEGYDYLWLGATSPAHTSLEMSKAYDLSCKTAWIFNVGDIKPQEFEYQFAMDLAWDVERWRPENAASYALHWANETFGEELGAQIADIKTQYYHMAASGRPEHIKWNSFSVAEMESRIARYGELVQKVKAVEAQMPERLKDAYFELIAYPVEATWAMNRKILGAKLSFEYAALGRRDAALAVALNAQQAYQQIQDLTLKYNKQIAGGKWDGMMDYAPRNHSFFYDPTVVDEDQIDEGGLVATPQDSVRSFEITAYAAKEDNGKKIAAIPGLGVGEASLAVLPLDLTEYAADNIANAPYVEYSLPVAKGENNIQVKCFPTFPIYEGKSLRYAISVDGGAPVFVPVGNGLGGGDALGENARWILDVRRSYTLGETLYQSDADKSLTVRIYFAEPGLVLSGISVVYPSENDLTGLIVNSDFEDLTGLRQDGATTYRGDPNGWTRTGELSGQSWGVNSDAANYHGQRVCWYNATPMPAAFELSQTINDLPPGEYILRCKLGVPNTGGITTQRLFAGSSVQYYGAASDYQENLTAGESNTFAGYAAEGDGSGINLKEMALKFMLADTTDLLIGIKSSNKLKSGASATNNAGWFKVDHFRLERVAGESPESRLQALIEEAQALYSASSEGRYDGMYPAEARATFLDAIQAAIAVKDNGGATLEEQIQAVEALEAAIDEYRRSVVKSTSYIVNPDFEDLTGLRQDGATTYRGDPYGWTRTGSLTGESWGVNSDAASYHGQYLCWYRSTPMPADFELYQNITGIPAGKYLVKCRLVVNESRLLTTQRLFADSNVQYFGKEEDYGENLTEGETNSFAGWTPNGSFSLKEMQVEVDVQDGNLKIGIRSSNRYKDGSQENSIESGWFKVDHFRLELKELYNTEPVDPVDPNDPTDPDDPTDPTDPVDPTDPNDPTDPDDPNDPTAVDGVGADDFPVSIIGKKGGISVRYVGVFENGSVSVYSLSGS
ncbi:MAG: glycosyl hydrolase 115 family protein, partial [Prevotellaceae bacterium]|nr:glycosyl hydrolase 115 family protein [Prevotellaceae bacterium]